MSQSTPEAELFLLRYPIGALNRAESFTPQQRSAAIEGIRELPSTSAIRSRWFLRGAARNPISPGGWTVRQLVHHVADSHMNAYVRMRLALTEDWPAVKGYQEACWAELEDARAAAVSTSLDLLHALHARWVQLFASLDEQGWKRGYVHSEDGRQSLEQLVMVYDWHGRHHTAHVTQLSARMGW